MQHLVTFPTKGDQLGFQVLSECAAPSYVVNIEILISAGDLPPAKRVCTSFGSRTRNYLAAVPTVDSKILVGRENEGIGKRFGHANQASIGESHRNVGILLDQFRDWLHVLGKREGDEQGAAAK